MAKKKLSLKQIVARSVVGSFVHQSTELNVDSNIANDQHTSLEQMKQVSQFELGTDNSESYRTRRQIYTYWELMLADSRVVQALSLLVTSAIGGHESNGDVIFISPSNVIRDDDNPRAKKLKAMVEKEANALSRMINNNIYSLAFQAVAYGDGYARIYTEKDKGVVGLVNNEYTLAPLIMSFERAGETLGFQVLQDEDKDREVISLTPAQMLRVKMPRPTTIPQRNFAAWVNNKSLQYDNKKDCPILPARVGGSLLYPVEGAWKDVIVLQASAMSKAISDSINQVFLGINMENMPKSQRTRFSSSIADMLTNFNANVKEALNKKEAIYTTKFHILPQMGSKQVVTPLGDIAQNSTPFDNEMLMTAMKSLAGGFGVDLSMMGFSEILSGGLGDGGHFRMSAQIMEKARLIRQALIPAINDLINLHFGVKYGEYFEDGEEPWRLDFYSDQTAAASEALSNKQVRASTASMSVGVIAQLKEANLSKESCFDIFSDTMGMDSETAERLSVDITSVEEELPEEDGGF